MISKWYFPLQEVEAQLGPRVSHVVRGQVRAAAVPCPPASVRRTRADAMLQRLSLGSPAASLATSGGHCRTLTVHQVGTDDGIYCIFATDLEASFYI